MNFCEGTPATNGASLIVDDQVSVSQALMFSYNKEVCILAFVFMH